MANAEESAFDCRAPQFYDSFAAADEDGADRFFDVSSGTLEDNQLPLDEFYTPLPIRPLRGEGAGIDIEETIAETSQLEFEPEESVLRRNTNCHLPTGRVILKAKRRSLQLPKNAESVKQEIENATRIFEGIQLETIASEKVHSMTTRRDVAVKTPTLSLRNRDIVRLQMKRAIVQSPSSKKCQPPVKYMALAEQVLHYFKDTPPRFRKSKSNQPRQLELVAREVPALTQPQSPVLLTKTRHRSPLPTEKETVQIKAQPLNQKILQKPDNTKPLSKPSTVPRPFNLTEVIKKEPKVEEEPTFRFKARPAPESCRSSSTSSVGSLGSLGSLLGISRVPMPECEDHLEPSHNGVENERDHNRNTTVVPFSFDLRDRQKQLAKMKKIQEMKEAAARIPKFTAQPLPSFIISSANSSTSSHPRSLPCSKEPPAFKAKPPTVLFKSPFTPKLDSKPLTNVTGFELNTERRARERAAFDKALMENAKANEIAAAQLAMEREKHEKQELIRLRRSIVHKAKPVPSTSRPQT